jgi:hypothetical protein
VSSDVAFRAKAVSYNDNTMSPSVVVPASVQAGDQLLLFVSGNTGGVTLNGPSGSVGGWTLLGSQTIGTQETSVWAATAAAGDAGATVSFETSGYTKIALQLLAYSGVGTATPVTASAADASSTTSHQAPAVAVAEAGSWVVSYWADKSSSTTGWAAAAGLTERDESIGSGGGRTSALVADSGAAVSTGTYAAKTATTNAASRASSFSIVLTPAG